jgi:transmembrane sensor
MKPNKGRLAKPGKKAFIEENFSNQQWQSFKPFTDLPAGKSEEMLRAVHEGIAAFSEAKQARRLKVVQLSRYLSAAAIVIVLGVALTLNYNSTDLKAARQEHVAAVPPSSVVVESIWKEVVNTGSSLRNIQLPDSSRVTIYPRSRIRYEQKFNHTFRNVYLTGKAKFKVKRNTSRPFSVYSGVLKTTALGTSFTINTAAAGNRISVMLHTGRIVIKDTTARHPLAYISTIGSTLLYNPTAKLVRVTNTKKRSSTTTEFMKREGDVIVMKNIPLAEVIRLLNAAYKIRIHASSQDIAAITFTGQVDTRKDQITDVLNMICTINNMTLTQASPQEFNIQKSIK